MPKPLWYSCVAALALATLAGGSTLAAQKQIVRPPGTAPGGNYSPGILIDGTLYVSVGGLGPAVAMVPAGEYDNRVVAIDEATGGITVLADIGAYELANNPDPNAVDSNVYGMDMGADGLLYVADAGGNAVVQVFHDGSFGTVTALPPGSALAPPFLGLPPGTQIPTDAVPTSVVRGPDGAYYISQLTGFPFEQGDANIWRVVPGESPTVHASGLTNLTDLEFAEDGTLYAVEISSAGLLNGPIGALVKITPGGSVHETIVGDLFAPYGVAIRNNFAYVSICAVCPGAGEVIKVPLD